MWGWEIEGSPGMDPWPLFTCDSDRSHWAGVLVILYGSHPGQEVEWCPWEAWSPPAPVALTACVMDAG